MNQDVEYLTEDLQKSISSYVKKEPSPEADRLTASLPLNNWRLEY